MKPNYRVCPIVVLALTLGVTGASAQTLTTLYSFTRGSDGGTPYAGLIADASGALYGTTISGGTTQSWNPNGSGTVFKLTPQPDGITWTFSTLYSFTGLHDGGLPYGGLIADSNGALYGTTLRGGNDQVPNGCGTVFKLTPPPTTTGGPWPLNTLYTFCGNINDANSPWDGLIADASGALYGTGIGGGNNNFGAVFKLTPQPDGTWTENVLYSFAGGNDGQYPYASLTADGHGTLYGVTANASTAASPPYGTAFNLTPPTPGGAWTESVLHDFAGGSDGAFPFGALLADADGQGAFYGTTEGALVSGPPFGTVFELTPPKPPGGSWTFSTLYNFTGGGDEGYPRAGLIADASGALYGTTVGNAQGSGPPYGTVFKLAPPTTPGGSWTFSTVYSFNGSDGAYPYGGLIADASGALYGTTLNGGTYGAGTVFKLTLPAATFKGVPGQANCHGQTISLLARTYGGIEHAAATLGYASVDALQDAVKSFCGS